MATKNVMKRVVEKSVKTPAVKVLKFNAKNTVAFADLIYSDKGGVITLLKLCNGTLSNGKDGGRTLHCAVGEAVATFVDPNVPKFVAACRAKLPENKLSDDEYETTKAAIEALVNVAQFKRPGPVAKKKLKTALEHAVATNDDAEGDDAQEYFERSKDVSNVFRHQVAPLLK